MLGTSTRDRLDATQAAVMDAAESLKRMAAVVVVGVVALVLIALAAGIR